MSPRLTKLFQAAAVVLAVADVGSFIGVVRAAQASLPPTSIPLRDPGLVTPPEGYAVGGKRFAVPSPGGCWVVRYEMSNCEYCSDASTSPWGRFAAAVGALHCPVFVIPPYPGDAVPPATMIPSNAKEEVLVGMEFAKHYRLSVTPTTMVFAAPGKLLWGWQGRVPPRGFGVPLVELRKLLTRGGNRR